MFTFTVNRHSFNPAVPIPYVIAIVELAEQADLRMITNIIGCKPEAVYVGMPVRVLFEEQGVRPGLRASLRAAGARRH